MEDERVGGWKYTCVDEWADGWVGGKYIHRKGWVGGWVGGLVGGWLDIWIMDEQTDGL